MIFALLGALAIGLSLGLLGSGGSILTVPVLALLLNRPEKLIIAESLAIVAVIALAGAIPYGIRRQIHWHSVIFFGLAGMVGAYTGACASSYISGSMQRILFVVVMLIASWKMVREPNVEKIKSFTHSLTLIIIAGFLVGCLTGLIGIGGGFLIVPTLVLLIQLPMHLAIGTSLIIIAINAFTGFFKHLMNLNVLEMQVNWSLIILFSILGILGSLIGSFMAKKVPQSYLRKSFGFCMIPIGLLMLLKEL